MNLLLPSSMCEFQRRFAERAAQQLHGDARVVALLLAGSAISDDMDEFSDLDFIVVCQEQALAEVLASKRQIAESLGTLVAAFSGEHVGEPQLLICLYAEPLLHVDLKFVDASALDRRVETPLVVWADAATTARLQQGTAQWPARDAEWFEERFWIWVHYGLSKVGRGELFEAIAMLNFLREQVVGPLLARSQQRDQRGVRRLERHFPAQRQALAATLAGHDHAAVIAAYRAHIALYLSLRAAAVPANRKLDGEALVQHFLDSLDQATTHG